MAEGQSMTVADVVAQMRDGRLEDFVREAVVLVARELMEAEIRRRSALGSARSRPRPGDASQWVSPAAVGDPGRGDRAADSAEASGAAYFPSFLEPRRRSEQAIVAVVLEAYVNGVSTRKVDRLVEQLGIEGMTKDRVSAICRAWMSRSSCSAAGRLRAPTRTCGWMPSTSRSATTAGSSPRRWWSPMRCTSPGCGR